MWSLSKNFAYDTPPTVAVDLGFSPDTYWPTSPTREQLLARIKGQIRRNVARHIIEEKGLIGLTSLLGRPSLTEAELDQWGKDQPEVMGGEYLPDLGNEEVEIARISVGAVLSDQVSVRARQENGRIKYAVVDEFETEFTPAFSESLVPLSLSELITFIDNTRRPKERFKGGLVQSYWNQILKEGGGLMQAARYARVESAYYPQLSAAYEQIAADWIEAQASEV